MRDWFAQERDPITALAKERADNRRATDNPLQKALDEQVLPTSLSRCTRTRPAFVFCIEEATTSRKGTEAQMSHYNAPEWPQGDFPPQPSDKDLPADMKVKNYVKQWIVLGFVLLAITITAVVIVVVHNSQKFVVPGVANLVTFESGIKHQLSSSGADGFSVANVGSVECSMPSSWTPGKVFPCYAYDTDNSEMGVLQLTIESTQPGDYYNTNVAWQPNPNYTPAAATTTNPFTLPTLAPLPT